MDLKPSLRFWVLPFIPLITGVAIAFLLRSFGRVNISVNFFDLSIWMGGFFTGIWMLIAFMRWQQAKTTKIIQQSTYEQAIVDRRRFLQRLDHELKNPLMAIRALIDNAMSKAAVENQESNLIQLLSSVNKQVIRLSTLVTDLRKVSDLETLAMEIGPVDLDLLLRDAFALLEEHPEAKNRRLLLMIPEAPWPLPTIQGDWDLLYLAIYNLLENGIKYSKEGDSIEVKAREADGKVTIDVADTGMGISAEDLPQIFDELFRSERTLGIGGSGLGLALSRAIIQRHEGSITAESRVGQGTVISVELSVESLN